MTKYKALKYFLLTQNQTEIKLSFFEIEGILGFDLPYSAYTYPAWWTNGGHGHAESWTSAGFITKNVDITHKTVMFCKKGTQPNGEENSHQQSSSGKQFSYIPQKGDQSLNFVSDECLSVCGYKFHFLQQLIPKCKDGEVIEYAPQKNYTNPNNLPLGPNGSGTFCRFSIHAPAVPGVYLWVVSGEIIYIGETSNLAQRFNNGYGNISPRNCYAGGQSTNCKMNKVVLEYYKKGKIIDLYFLKTENYKQIELSLLHQIKTKYNVKDNSGGDNMLDWDRNGRIDPVDIGISLATHSKNGDYEEETKFEDIQTPSQNSTSNLWAKILRKIKRNVKR